MNKQITGEHVKYNAVMDILSAAVAGKQINYGSNHNVDPFSFQYRNILFQYPQNFSIHKEPVTRPWNCASEVPALPIQVRFKGSETNHRTAIVAANDNGIWLAGASIIMTHADAFLELEKIDGSQCGITEAQP